MAILVRWDQYGYSIPSDVRTCNARRYAGASSSGGGPGSQCSDRGANDRCAERRFDRWESASVSAERRALENHTACTASLPYVVRQPGSTALFGGMCAAAGNPMASDTKAKGYSHSVAGAVTAVQRPGKTGGAGASTGQSEKQGRGPSIETGPGPQSILRNGTDDPEMVLGCCRHRRR